jgi:hypothetical protein
MSSIQFYIDDACSEKADLGNTTGPPDGYCTSFGVGGWLSFRVMSLERTCAGRLFGQNDDQVADLD